MFTTHDWEWFIPPIKMVIFLGDGANGSVLPTHLGGYTEGYILLVQWDDAGSQVIQWDPVRSFP